MAQLVPVRLLVDVADARGFMGRGNVMLLEPHVAAAWLSEGRAEPLEEHSSAALSPAVETASLRSARDGNPGAPKRAKK